MFRLGRDGRNSFRTDFAVYDEPYDNLRGKTLEERLERVRVLAEIKRDNSTAESAKATEVRGALNQIDSLDALEYIGTISSKGSFTGTCKKISSG